MKFLEKLVKFTHIIKKNVKSINYAIEVLFFTNVWINSYLFLLSFLNNKFPISSKPDPNLFINKYLFPEPFEIPVYILTSVVMTLFIYTFYLYRKNLLEKIKILIPSKRLFSAKCYILCLLLLLFFYRLGEYPIFEKTIIPRGPFVLYIFILAVAVFVVKIVDSRISERKFKPAKHLFILFFIAFLTFEPGFPMGPNDYGYFLGPIYEIVNGKTIYTQVPSLYGFLSVVSFVPLVKLGFNIIYLPFFIWLFFILEYYICFYVIYKFSKSIIFSFLGLLSILTINYYSVGTPSLIPAGNAFRWPPLIMAILLLSYFKNINSKVFIFLLALIVFWTPDSGIALIFGFVLTLFVFSLKGTISWKKMFLTICYFFLNTVFIYIIINFLHSSFGYRQIELPLIFEKIQKHGLVGLNMVPIESRTFFWTVILIYLASIAYYFKYGKINLKENCLVFVANLSLFASIYYVSRSVPTNLFLISIFPILNLYLLINLFLSKTNLKNLRRTMGIISLVLVLIPAYFRNDSLSNSVEKKINRLIKGNIFRSDLNTYLRNEYKPEIDLINNNFNQKEIIIDSIDDTYLFYLTGKKNMLNANPLGILYGKIDVERVVKDISKCPTEIIVSCQIFNNNCKENLIYFHWEKVLQRSLLETLEKRCNVKYKIKKCTARLCIVDI